LDYVIFTVVKYGSRVIAWKMARYSRADSFCQTNTRDKREKEAHIYVAFAPEQDDTSKAVTGD
jgi:hypothetical protein